MIYVEEYLQHYVENIGVEDSNKQILESINRQVKKGMALTDRQHDLIVKIMQEKLEGFTGNEPVREPLRQIDRSKYITVVDTNDFITSHPYESYKQDWQWIKVRFPFAKKTIVSIEKIANTHRTHYYHKKGSHEHFFKLTENTVKDICLEFSKKDFEISEQILELYNQIVEIEKSPLDYIPCYVDNQLRNVDLDISDLKPYQVLDRKRQLGLSQVDAEVPAGIVGTICNRDSSYILIKPSLFSIDNLVSGIVDLDRYPLLVLITPGKELDQMTTVYNAFKNVVDNSQQCALFRVENKNNEYNVNNFIHEKSLNNWLDQNTKIVYIKSDKLPKLLIKEEWVPQSVLSLDSTRKNSTVTTYVKDVCDLIIDFDNEPNIFRGTRIGYM